MAINANMHEDFIVSCSNCGDNFHESMACELHWCHWRHHVAENTLLGLVQEGNGVETVGVAVCPQSHSLLPQILCLNFLADESNIYIFIRKYFSYKRKIFQEGKKVLKFSVEEGA